MELHITAKIEPCFRVEKLKIHSIDFTVWNVFYLICAEPAVEDDIIENKFAGRES